MPEPIDDEFKLLLARAFDLAWEQFQGPDILALSPKTLHGLHLLNSWSTWPGVEIREQNALAAAGILHLVALTMDRSKR